MGQFVNQDAEEKKESPEKSHDPIGGPTQVRIIGREVATGQTPGNQAKDDEPSII
jgi:hypothetical protein